MTYIRTTLFIAIVFLLPFQAMCQQERYRNALFLRTGIRELLENSHSAIALPAAGDIFEGHYYRYLQFYTPPTLREKNYLSSLGIRLIQYLPESTWIAAIPVSFDPSRFYALGVRSITAPEPWDKMPDFPKDWVNSAPQVRVEVLIQWFSDAVSDKVLNILKNDYKLSLRETDLESRSARVETSLSQLVQIAALPFVSYIEAVESGHVPEDDGGRSMVRANTIATDFASGYHYDGAGVHIAVGDDGLIGPHIDFSNRISQSAVAGIDNGSHGDIIAGILTGAGNLDPSTRGAAPGAYLHVLSEFEAIKKAPQLYTAEGVVITCTSYADGCNRGYTTLAEQADQQIRDYPSLLHVFSAGNAGEQDCGYGAGPGWGNITGGVKTAKNVIAVANIDANDVRVATSSRGPASDGRIKPDLAANGDGQVSTLPDNSYGTGTGTSAAAPAVAGVLAQLYQAYRQLHNGANPESALLKACLMNTAEDLGTPGPDFSYGWGRINAWRALHTLENNHYFSSAVQQDEMQSFSINVPAGARELKVMVYWTDPDASPVSAKSLVNDIDMVMLDPSDQSHLPWVLNTTPDPFLLSAPATTGEDHLNNVEQISITNPVEGAYQIHIKGSEIPEGIQNFYVVYQILNEDIFVAYPLGGEHFQAGEQSRILWDAAGNDGTFSLSFSSNNGNSWTPIGEVPGNVRQFNWTVPTATTARALVKVTRNNHFDTSDGPFHIFNTPTGLEIVKVCPDYTRLQWDSVPGAQQYILYKLGSAYMDSLTTVAGTTAEAPIESPNEVAWYAVQACGADGARSRRSLAVKSANNLFNCFVTSDISLTGIASPAGSTVLGCFNTPLSVSIHFKNTGQSIQSNFPVSYQVDNQAVVTEWYNNPLPPGLATVYQFATPVSSTTPDSAIL